MRMSWCLPVGLLVIVTLIAVSAAFDESFLRTKRETNTTCDPKYLELSRTHTRCLEDNPEARLVPLTQDVKDAIVQKHNDLRANVDPPAADMLKMRWDDTLAGTAEKWAKQCKFGHDRNRDRKEPDWPWVYIGQNVGLGHANFDVMINRFYSEKDRMNYIYGGGYKRGAGHFFQVVSALASRIGCAEVKCPPNKVIRVCNYAERLDASKPPYKNGTWCSACPNHCDSSDSSGRLCDCGGKFCYHNGRLNVTTCQCRCQYGWKGNNCETRDCDKRDPLNSCRNGRYTEADCGKYGTVIHDPNMCPHLCGLCPKCNGKQCQNNGQLNTKTCKCACQPGWLGDTCEQSCADLDCKNCGRVDPEACKCICQEGWRGHLCDEPCPTDSQECAPLYSNTHLFCSYPSVAHGCPVMCNVTCT